MTLKRRRLRCEDYTVGWVCALPIELAAAKAILDEEDEYFLHDNESLLYTLGRIGDHNVVIACLPAGQIGTNSAATAAAQMKSKFTAVRFGLMVGVGGGVPGKADIRLGDVVVSQPGNGHGGVIQYDFGKTSHGDVFRRTGSLNTPPTTLLSAVAEVRANHHIGRSCLMKALSGLFHHNIFSALDPEHDVLFPSTYSHVGGRACNQCNNEKQIKRDPRPNRDVVVHYGTIASGNSVMKDGLTRERLDIELGGVLCFEMEAAGLMNSFPCLVIRGICDYADSHKNKQWQPYASATAAACAKEILSVIPSRDVAPMKTVQDTVRLEERVHSAIDNLNLDEFLSMLPLASQEEWVSPEELLDPNDPAYTWIIRNIDFQTWSKQGGAPVLWICGGAERNIHLISSYVANRQKCDFPKTESVPLYFFLSSVLHGKPPMTIFLATLLCQCLRTFHPEQSAALAKYFLKLLRPRLVEWAYRHPQIVAMGPGAILQQVFDLPVDDIRSALAELLIVAPRRFSLIVDGLDKAHRHSEFVQGVWHFITRVSDGMEEDDTKFYVLLTSRPAGNIKATLRGAVTIEHDREREDCLSSLRFENTRYEKISREHEGSFEWIWWHSEYRNWSTRDTSQVLYIQGKPGSGKSTLARYFHDNLVQREPCAASAIIANFFYSHREGQQQTSHSNMLRTILYDILAQDEGFFYHEFQINYRKYQALVERNGGVPMDWPYWLLKDTLASLHNYARSSRYYLIIDAIDESDENDRRDILNFLFDVCANTKHCTVKALIASRPVGQLEVRRSQFHGFIRLQDETKHDILNFSRSFLRGLNLTVLLDKAVTYIIDNAHGVFIWVQLVGAELVACAEEGSSEEEIFEFLESLPLELDAFYTLMLRKMMDRRNLEQTLEIFHFVLFAQRPLTVSELLHALAIPKDLKAMFEPSLERLHRRLPTEQRLVHCGGNFLEIRPYQGNSTIQVIHQTVREFFLRPDGCVATSGWRMVDEAAHRTIAVVSIRYLLVLITGGPVGEPTSWSTAEFEQYIQHLTGMPFVAYILTSLGHHLARCLPDSDIANLVSGFLDKVVETPSYQLLKGWITNTLYEFTYNRLSEPDSEGFRGTALIVAARQGHLTAVEVLIHAGADVEYALNSDDKTPLSWAACNGNIPIVEFLLSRGAQLNRGTSHKDGRSPLSWAASNGHKALVQLLLTRGAHPTTQDTMSGRTPLSWAVSMGQEEIVKLLLFGGKSDFSIEGQWDRDRTLLSRAAETGHKRIAKLLLDQGADVEGKDAMTDRTPLSWAAAKGHKDVIRLLIENGASLESTNKYGGRTPLLWAVEAGHKSAAKILLDRGAGIEVKDSHTSRTPLTWAVAGGHSRVIKLLLKRGADVESRDGLFGRTPLIWAAVEGQEGSASLLLDHGADIESRDTRSDRTALSWAVEKGHEDVVALLLNRGADTEARDNYDGRTPLSLAAEHGHKSIARLLLAKGADVGATDDIDDGRTPLWWATQNGDRGVINLLHDWDPSNRGQCPPEIE
ncbi:hypothetical protein BJY01DRAFT_226732 [Aspergillus pseudoustus]|uniref:protein S-acyltransferase n=1 Tax=Aspergillus pseudoustus TaxID=1810923 RepID=A0ABR4IUD2_9EURO